MLIIMFELIKLTFNLLYFFRKNKKTSFFNFSKTECKPFLVSKIEQTKDSYLDILTNENKGFHFVQIFSHSLK